MIWFHFISVAFVGSLLRRMCYCYFVTTDISTISGPNVTIYHGDSLSSAVVRNGGNSSQLERTLVTTNSPEEKQHTPVPEQKAYSVHSIKKFYIGYLLSMEYDDFNVYTGKPVVKASPGKHYAGAFTYALKMQNVINRQHNFTLDFYYKDIRQNTYLSINAMTQQYFNGVIGFVGPDVSCTDEAKIAAAWNRVMVSGVCGDLRLSRKDIYPSFARTIPPTTTVSKSMVSMMRHFKWDKFVLVVQNSTMWQEVARGVEKGCAESAISITANRTIPHPFTGDGTDPEEIGNLVRIINETHEKTRIYVFLGEAYALINFARQMHDRGLLTDGKYVIIAVKEKPFDDERMLINEVVFQIPFENWGDLPNKTVEKYISAFRSVLILTLRLPKTDQYEYFKDQVREYNTLPPFNGTKPPSILFKVPVKVESAYVYDAVTILSRAVRELVKNGSDPFDSKQVFNRIRSRHYKSIQGYDVFMDENGDPEGNYTVLAIRRNPNEGLGWDMKPVANFLFENRTGNPSFIYDNGIEWVGGSAPPSEPECGFDGRKCEPEHLSISLGVSITVVLCLIAAVFGYRHYMYENRLARLLWKINQNEIQVTGTTEETTNFEKLRKKSSIKYGFLNTAESVHSRTRSVMKKVIYTKIGTYKGTVVAIKQLPKKRFELNRAVKKELYLRKEMAHENINRFIGACVDAPLIWIVAQYCTRGSLKDILANKDIRLDEMFIASLVNDLVKGMNFIHESEIMCHGNLKSTKCLVDSRWVLQIADFGLHSLRSPEQKHYSNEEDYYSKLLWRPPELLRSQSPLPRGTQKADVYSFALILNEIFGRCGPWGKSQYSSKDVIEKVKNPESSIPFRPGTAHLNCEHFILKTMYDCWDEDPDARPDFKSIRIKLRPLQNGLSVNIFDNMLAIMEKYATNLESLVSERTRQLREEKKTTESLLLRMLPRSVAEQLKRGKDVVPEHYSSVTIYFSDIVGFTSLSAASTPMQVVDMLNDLYTCFDSVIGNFDVYKVETIGDAYMVVSGLPIRNGDNHAGEIASMSLNLLTAIKTFRIRHRANEMLKLRIGIHSGPCVAGVVGLTMPRYCLFGDTVNTASRMESNGVEWKIHCSEQSKLLLDKLGGYSLKYRGMINIKGKGEMPTYFLTSEDSALRLRRLSENNNTYDCDSDSSLCDEVLEVEDTDESCRLLPHHNGRIQFSVVKSLHDCIV